MMIIYGVFALILMSFGILIILSFRQGIKELKEEREKKELETKMLKENKELNLNELNLNNRGC